MPQESFKIIFDDEHVIVINKIAKVLIQPSPKKEKITLTYLLAKDINQKVFPCHRLDRETTGLIIYAKSQAIEKRIMEEFKRGQVKKKYLAFVKGKLKVKKGLLKDYIIDREAKIYGEPKKLAKTGYQVLKGFKDWSLVEFIPLTGRTNQLRIQMAKIGHPILGERKYAFGRDFKVKFRRLALHAYYLSFIHPLAKQRVNLEIDLPKDMKTFLCKVKQ